MRAVLLQNAEWQQAGALRPGDAVAELGRRQLLPMHRQLVLSRWRLCPCDRDTECVDGNQNGSVHVSSRIAFEPSVMRLRESLGLAKSATPPGGLSIASPSVRRQVPHFSCTAWCRCVDRKSTRLNSSHLGISYAVFCLKKKNN